MTRMMYPCVYLLLGLGPVCAQPTPSPPDLNLEKVKEPELAGELGRRGDMDQKCRKDTIRFMAQHKLVEPVQTDKLEPTVAATYKLLRRKEQDIDRDNLAWIKKVVAKHGWPGKSLVGPTAAQNAFLIVQHAVSDPEFMESCLRKMEAAGGGEVEPTNLAYLTDRVLLLRGKKQKYGTQLQWQDGKLIASPIEDEAKVDERRKTVGLGPLKDYLKTSEALYKNAEGIEPDQRPDQTTQPTTGKAPPIPKMSPLANPRSLEQVGVPVELTRSVTPQHNPQTPEKIALGQKLFFEGRLSADGTVACATCHDPARAFTDGRPASIGIHGRTGQRNAPTILNALYNKTQFWDGRAKTLEEQAGLPITNPFEMGQPTLEAAVAKIAAIEEYQQAFQQVFGRPVNGPNLLRAIAAYERTLVSFDSPFDHFIAGDKNAIDDAAKRGWDLFNTKARCNKCHALSEKKRDTTNFIDNDFHNIGIGIIKHNVVALARKAEEAIASGHLEAVDRAAIQTDMSVLGRFLITKKEADTASFKTPNLRNVLVTSPYFHDGSQETLWDVMDHYNKGDGLKNPWLDEDIQPLALTEREIDDLVAFLASLTSPLYKELGAKELARQRTLSRTTRPQRDTERAFGPKPPRPKPP